MDPVAPTERLVGVYDADGGIRGEVAHVLGHLVGRTECALCTRLELAGLDGSVDRFATLVRSWPAAD